MINLDLLKYWFNVQIDNASSHFKGFPTKEEQLKQQQRLEKDLLIFGESIDEITNQTILSMLISSFQTKEKTIEWCNSKKFPSFSPEYYQIKNNYTFAHICCLVDFYEKALKEYPLEKVEEFTDGVCIGKHTKLTAQEYSAFASYLTIGNLLITDSYQWKPHYVRDTLVGYKHPDYSLFYIGLQTGEIYEIADYKPQKLNWPKGDFLDLGFSALYREAFTYMLEINKAVLRNTFTGKVRLSLLNKN